MSKLNLGGIRIRIHLLFWAVIGISVAAGRFVEMLTLIVIVIIHELGHVAVARELGWTVAEIQLLPFGGVATIEDAVAADPLDEIVVALAGPFLNMVMMFISLCLWWTNVWTAEWTRFFVAGNMLIAGFNLLPIWPLDGGRIVQALLCYHLPYRRAVMISLSASSMLAALLLGVSCLSFQLDEILIATYLLLINVYTFFRFPYQFMRFLMEKYVRQPGETTLRSVRIDPEVTALQATQQLRRGCYHLFYVRNAGFLPEERLLHALLFEQKHDVAVSRLV